MRAAGYDSTTMRVVVSVYERPDPYRHFVISAYEPQTSREWEVLADSIDVFKMFFDRSDPAKQAIDLANPVTRQMVGEALVDAVELLDEHGELTLIVVPEKVREHVKTHADKAGPKD